MAREASETGGPDDLTGTDRLTFETDKLSVKRRKVTDASRGGNMLGVAAGRRAVEAAAKVGKKPAAGSLLTRRRFQFAGALVMGALIPWLLRGPILPGTLTERASLYTLWGNITAIIIAFWMRLSIEPYPGIRRSYVIFPAALTGHGIVLTWFVLTRFP